MSETWTFDPPRVLQVIDALRRGGAESLLVALVRELAATGAASTSVLALSAQHLDPGLLAELETASESVQVLPGNPPLYDLRVLRAVFAAQRRGQPDVVHSHLGGANVNSRVAAALLRQPHLTTVHTAPGPRSEETRIRQLADRLTARLSTRLVAPSVETAEAYAKAVGLPIARVGVIPNAPAAPGPPPGFDRARARAELAGTDDALVVLCVARLQVQKGITDLIDATAIACERIPTLRVLVAGWGPEEARLTQHVASKRLDGRVRLLGSRDDMGSLLAASDVFCLPSWHEGIPLSLLEAMEAGVACVATAVGGVPSVVTDGESALLVPSHDPERLAVALERALSDTELRRRLGEKARKVVAERYSRASVAERYADIYRELAVRGRRASREAA